MDLSDQELYDRLLGALGSRSSIETGGEPGVVTISVFEGLELDPPMRLHVDPQVVGLRVREIADSSYVQPGTDPAGASIGLFLLHIEEAVHTARDGETELQVVSYGVESYRPDGTKTPFAPEVEEYIALNDFHERLIEHYADRGETELDIRHEMLILHDLDGRSYRPPLRVQVTSAEMRTQLRPTDDREAYWHAVVDEIDRLALTTDARVSMIALTPDGVVTRPLSEPLPRRDAGFGWSAHAPESGSSYP